MSIDKILSSHLDTIREGFLTLNVDTLWDVGEVLCDKIAGGKTIFTCGNGASAAIAQHWACDYTKGCSKIEDDIKPRVIALSANIPLMTAIANDISYDEVYAYQLDRLGTKGDVLIIISSSGNSPTVVRAIEAAKKAGIETIALTGFDGGQCAELADFSLHVNIPEYEAAEDVHQAIMHILAKYIRQELWK